MSAILAALTGSATSALQAQDARGDQAGRIEGRAIDAATREPLLGVSVVVDGERSGAITDADGRYTITRLSPGTYRLRAVRIGYGEAVIQAVRVEPGQATTADFALRAQAVPLPAVTALADASGSRAERLETAVQTRAEASLATVEVAAQTARDFNSANAYDALRVVPGVSYLWEAGGRHGQPSRIRGASSWVISDAIEDFPTLRLAGIGSEDGGLTAGLGAAIPAIAIRSIDVKKGSLGVLYSGDANGVIVNELKRGAPGRPTGTVWFEASPIAEQLAMADVGGGTEHVNYYFAGKLLNGSYDDLLDPAERALSDDDFHSGLARIGWTPRPEMRLELLALRARDRIAYTRPRADDPGTPDIDESRLAPNEFRTTNSSGFYGVTFDHSVGERTSYEVGYSGHQNEALRFSVTEGMAHRDRPQETHTVFGNLYLTRRLSDDVGYSAKLGLESVWQDQQERAGDSGLDQHFQDRSIFYTNTLSFGPSVFVNAGLRYVDAKDDWRNHDIWVYNAGLAYQVPRLGTRTRVAYTTGYSREKGFAFFFGPIDEAGGIELGENQTIEAGIDQPWTVGGQRGLLSVTAYRTRNDRTPTFSGWGAQTVYYEDHEVDGIEVSAEQRVGRLARVLGSLAYTDTEILSTTHPEGVRVGSTAIPVPRYTGALALELSPLERLRVSAIGTYDDGMRQEEIDTRTGEWTIMTNTPYTRVNLAADYEVFDWATAKIRVENLLDENDLGYSTETIGPNGRESAATVARDPGRFVSFGVVLRY